MSKIESIMRAVKAYGEACSVLSRTEGDLTDARKHEQCVWCAIRDMLAAEFEPLEWVESEESMRGAPLYEVLRNSCVSVIWHHKPPDTTNPVWEVRGQ